MYNILSVYQVQIMSSDFYNDSKKIDKQKMILSSTVLMHLLSYSNLSKQWQRFSQFNVLTKHCPIPTAHFKIQKFRHYQCLRLTCCLL